MKNIELDQTTKEAVVERIKDYFSNELQQEIGGFEAQFLLDFFCEQVGLYYYNQGLADALQAFENKIEEFSESVYELQRDPP